MPKRTFKFRVWDEKSKAFLVKDGECFASFGNQLKDYIYSLGSILNGDFPHLTTQQFTGVKDKNGKEIYEGDIVKCIQGEETFISNKGIGFSGGAFWFYGETCFPLLQTYSAELEVIGNVFENPELSKPKR